MAQNNPFPNISMEQIMSFAASPAGQQLITVLQKQNTADISNAQKLAAAGDMEEAKKALASLLSDPKISSMLKQFGG